MIINRQRTVSFSAKGLERLARTIEEAVGITPDSFTVALVSDDQMRVFNRRFRGRRAPTDVLSFPTHRRGPRSARNAYLGDVAISLETAKRQARRLDHSLRTELGLLMLHGVLHLLGYDHESDQGQMNRREHALRRRLRFT
ncbi:MAG: rRNA maturation RNase YbeY [Terriglobia bacterium]